MMMPQVLSTSGAQSLEQQHSLSMRKRPPAGSQQVKVRRTRQPRNPQLSVARRNERERNRVKMVNNGFALLREHLPIEDLQAHSLADDSGDDTPTPDCGAAKGQSAKSGRKFSKVETLRAAIARIRMLEELIRSTEPNFASMNIQQAPTFSGSTGSQQSSVLSNQGAFDMDEMEPLSVCEPLSNHSLASSHSPVQQVYTPQQQQQQHQQQQQPQQAQQHYLSQVEPASSPEVGAHPAQSTSHTHLWIQQHQNSFMEQQQQQQHYGQMESPVSSASSSSQQNSWYMSAPGDWNNCQLAPSPPEVGGQQQLGGQHEQAWLMQQQQASTHQHQSQGSELDHHHIRHQIHQQQQQQQQISLYSQ